MTEREILKMIYPSVVTFGTDWRKMVGDVVRLKLTEISLFLTGSGYRERQELYNALNKSSVRFIPHVHARHDTKEEEIDFLVKRFRTKFFNTHYQYLPHFKKSKHFNKIVVENNSGLSTIRNLGALKKTAGLCIDLSHLKQFERHNLAMFKLTEKTVQKYQIRCNHLSAVKKDGYSWHYVRKMSELDYAATIPKRFFSEYINIELRNNLSEQLRFKKYIAGMLAEAWSS